MRDTGPFGRGFGQPETSAYVPDALGVMRVALYSHGGLGIGCVGRSARTLRAALRPPRAQGGQTVVEDFDRRRTVERLLSS